MWDEYLVSRLSSKASQVLLSLLLTRQVQVQKSSMEFAKLTGLGQRSIAPALLELKSAGLIDIIPQPGKLPLVRLVHPEEYRYETTVTEVGVPGVETDIQPLLRGDGTGGSESDNKADKEQTPNDSGGSGGVRPTPAELLDDCRMADESQDKELRIASLQDVWDFAFPYDEYPNQRLSNLNAQRLLVNRSAEWVGGVVIDAVDHATSRIQAPRAYIQKAVDMEEKRKGQESGQVISDDLRKLVQLGKEQFGAKSKDSPGDLE